MNIQKFTQKSIEAISKAQDIVIQNQNAQVETLEIQDAPAAPVQDVNQTVQPSPQIVNQNVEQQPTTPAQEKSEENVEILG